MESRYCLVAKTGDAELRALSNIPKENMQKILPIIELTRGRKITNKEVKTVSYPYDKRLEKIKEIFQGQDIVIDVTSDESLSSYEIDALFENGYVKWIELLKELKNSGLFNSIIPSVLINYDDPEFDQNLEKEITQMDKLFSSIMFRYILDQENDPIEDLKFVSSKFPKNKELLVVLDCGYVPASAVEVIGKYADSRLGDISKCLENREHKIVFVSTTFPNKITEPDDGRVGTIKICEIDLFDNVKRKYANLIYGDYGSINPKRNDEVVMARGWIPRIDVALKDRIFYYRLRRPKGVSSYSTTYVKVANAVTSDSCFPVDYNEIWGLQQIKNCSLGIVPSSSPSFWISVRMNTHVLQQIKRIYP